MQAHIAADMAADPYFCRQVQQLYQLGPRLPVELLAEVASDYGLEGAIRKKLKRYLDIPDAALDVAGARHFPPSAIHEVLS